MLKRQALPMRCRKRYVLVCTLLIGAGCFWYHWILPDSREEYLSTVSFEEATWLKRWRKHQQFVLERDIHLNALRSLNAKIPETEVYDPYEPEWSCEVEERFGPAFYNVGDGPKFVCAPAMLDADDCIVYSIGSYYDFKFEYAVHGRAQRCEIHTFDGTMNLDETPLPATALKKRNIAFHNWNIVAERDSNSQFPSKSFRETLIELGHSKRIISWLKIDCEGCEFTVLPEIFAVANSSISQIMIEVHGTNAAEVDSLFSAISKAGFMIFHKERNQWGCSGIYCVEFALISQPMARKVHNAHLKGHTFD